MENKAKKIPALIMAAFLIFLCVIPHNVFASGSYYISTSSLSVTQGSSTTFTLGATNAVGAFTISTDGGVTASCSGEQWLDNSSVTITVTGNTVGTGHVYISIYDGADYDGNDLSGKSYTVTVTVKSASGGTVSETTTVAATEATTTAASSSDDDDDDDDDGDDEEETTGVSEAELLTVEADGVSMTVLKDVSGIDIPEGFEIVETVYNTVTVQTMVYEDITLYVLEDEDGNAEYYTLSDSGEFEVLKYTLIDGVICIFLDMPDNLEIPNGYILVETEIFGCTVEALTADSQESTEDETDEETDESEEESSEEAGEVSAAEYISFDTVAAENGAAEDEAEDETESAQSSVITIDDMVASLTGHYYVYCLYGGQKILFDYDSEEGTFGRCTALMILEAEDETEAETEAQNTAEDTQEEDNYTLILFLGLAAAAVIIIVLVIVLIVVLVRKRTARKKEEENLDSIFFDEEDIFAGEEAADEETQKEERPEAMSFKEAAELKQENGAGEAEEAKGVQSGAGAEEDDEDWAAEITDEDFAGLVYELDLEDEVVLEELAEIEAEEDEEEEAEEEDELFAAILKETVVEQKKEEAKAERAKEAEAAKEAKAPEEAEAEKETEAERAEEAKASEEPHRQADEDAAGVGDILSEEFENIMDYINA